MTNTERSRLREAVSAVLAQLGSTGGPGGHCKAAARRHIVHDFAGEDGNFVYRLAAQLAEHETGRWFSACLARYHRPAFESLDDDRIEALGRGIADKQGADAFARILAGPAWLAGRLSDERVHAWARGSGWWPRIALVSTVALNSRSDGGDGDTPRTLDVCRLLADRREPEIRDALEWALRSLAKHDPVAAADFARTHAPSGGGAPVPG